MRSSNLNIFENLGGKVSRELYGYKQYKSKNQHEEIVSNIMNSSGEYIRNIYTSINCSR